MDLLVAAPAARPRRFAHLFAALIVAAACGVAHADELGVNLYGLSYHFDRAKAQAIEADNTVNPGLGFRYRFADSGRWQFFADGGVYYDSGRNTAKYAGVGALWSVASGFQAGAALAVFHSDTYNGGRAFLAPLPMLAWDVGPVTLNLIFSPKMSRFNDVATLGFWVTLWPGRW